MTWASCRGTSRLTVQGRCSLRGSSTKVTPAPTATLRTHSQRLWSTVLVQDPMQARPATCQEEGLTAHKGKQLAEGLMAQVQAGQAEAVVPMVLTSSTHIN
mmetsp:Transcript_19796/g.50249  ORF Transcript_19796/g.50249 Transcript_19796/m.50249 type:complete len:101 (+) Transcript_19796:108-410(+)